MIIDDRTIEASITALLRERGSRVLPIREIADRLAGRGAGESRDEIEAAVERMERAGELVAVRGKRYSLLEFTPYLSGKLKVHPDGHGFLYTPKDESDIYIPKRDLHGAMNGDLVLVRVDRRNGRSRRVHGKEFLEGEVTRVLRREHSTVVGRFHHGDQPFLRPFDVRLDDDILIDPHETLGAEDGEMVNVEIERYADRSSDAWGRVIERLGRLGDPGVDIEVVIRKFKIPFLFPEEVIEEAEAIPTEIPAESVDGRRDLRDRVIITIDGETAKDFDDAVDVTLMPNGNYRLGVHIADVSHYVTPGSALDREAFERGTSVYFPGRAVPMLPERLSNGICSLNPRVDRLTFSAEIEIDAKARFVRRECYRSVIRTRERMTYTAVHAILEHPDEGLLERYREILDDVHRMRELFEILRRRRDSRGSIDFDLPEADVLLGNEGEIESIRPTQRNIAHRMIEEFMLAANEVVAEQLVFSSQPGIYRVHQPPDAQRIEDLRQMLAEFKHKLRGDAEEIRPAELQRILSSVAGTPEERFLTELVLRSMKRALYSEESTGHFALALQHYCHFTSPIRRYPDLIVHRRLGELLQRGALYGEERERVEAAHPSIAKQSSERERRADDAEREVIEWKKVIYMRDKVGLEFDGIVTGVMPFGLFVELDEIFVQGLVPISSIQGDYWVYFEKEHRLRGSSTSREFRLGDPVRIVVKEIDEDRRQIEFRLAAAEGEARQAPRRPGRARPRR